MGKINGCCFWWVGVSALDARVNAHVDPMALSAAGVGEYGDDWWVHECGAGLSLS